jgi:hypothetical protein
MVTPYRTMDIEVFGLQNHPIVKELYRRHGKDLCFMGVVIIVAHDSLQENERAATMAANLVKWVLGADGVILTKCGGGIPEVAMAMTAKRCEELGVRTSLALVHYPTVISGGDTAQSGGPLDVGLEGVLPAPDGGDPPLGVVGARLGRLPFRDYRNRSFLCGPQGEAQPQAGSQQHPIHPEVVLKREKDWIKLLADDDAIYDRVVDINLSELEPLAATPHSPGCDFSGLPH